MLNIIFDLISKSNDLYNAKPFQSDIEWPEPPTAQLKETHLDGSAVTDLSHSEQIKRTTLCGKNSNKFQNVLYYYMDIDVRAKVELIKLLLEYHVLRWNNCQPRDYWNFVLHVDE